jgi:hypothetical protein
VRKKRLPSGFSQNKRRRRIVAALFAITLRTGEDHVAWNMEAHAKSIHSIQVLNCRTIAFQRSSAIAAGIAKALQNGFSVSGIIHAEVQPAAQFPTDVVQEHADKFISDIGFCPASRSAQIR